MRIVVVIPTPDGAKSAGVRIRYRRIAPPLSALGHRLDIVALADLVGETRFDAEVYLFSKCHDVRSVLLAQRIARTRTPAGRGPVVGVDLFDDYFSQTDSSRFTHLRDWLSRIRPLLSFGLCSTPGMQAVLAAYAPGLSAHVMNDPFGRFDARAVGRALTQSAEAARATRTLEIGWFGTGDNPNFPVGLQDLSAMADRLSRMRRAGYAPRLSILTNRRAMTADRLAMLARLPLPWTIEDWTEAREQALIARSLACFLPVNAQGFSAVKSLNRAVSTLTGGAQVLSAGYPLYDPLGNFVYRDPLDLITDLEADRLRVAPATLGALSARLDEIGDPQAEARRLADFLTVLHRSASVPAAAWAAPRTETPPAPEAVLLGLRNAPDLHEGLRAMQVLIVGNPIAPGKRACDVTVGFGDGRATVTLSRRAVTLLPDALAARLNSPDPDDGSTLSQITLTATDLPDLARPLDLPAALPPIQQLETLAVYDAVAARLAAVLHLLYPKVRVHLAEMSAPYRWTEGPTGGDTADPEAA